MTNHIHINNWQIKFENNRVVFNSLDSGRSIPYAVVHRGHITATNQLANKPSTVHTLIINGTVRSYLQIYDILIKVVASNFWLKFV